MEKMKAHVGKMEAKLKHWGTKIDDLASKAKETGTEVKIDYHKRIDDLKSKHKLAQAKLDELKTTGTEKWNTFSADIESAWKEIEVAFKNLTK